MDRGLLGALKLDVLAHGPLRCRVAKCGRIGVYPDCLIERFRSQDHYKRRLALFAALMMKKSRFMHPPSCSALTGKTYKSPVAPQAARPVVLLVRALHPAKDAVAQAMQAAQARRAVARRDARPPGPQRVARLASRGQRGARRTGRNRPGVAADAAASDAADRCTTPRVAISFRRVVVRQCA